LRRRARRRCERRCERSCGRRRGRGINIYIVTYWFVSEIVGQNFVIYFFKIFMLSVCYVWAFDVLV
jgi:hypothetical protein